MKENKLRGHTNYIILSILEAGNLYGYEIKKEILNISNNKLEIKNITLYKALERLEKLHLVKLVEKKDKLTKGGIRKYYKITKKGKKELENNKEEWIETKKVLNSFLSKKVVIGEEIIKYSEIDSTNSESKRNIERLENGDVLVSDYQTNGKGRFKRPWESKKGNDILMTLVLKENIVIENLGDLNQIISVSIFSTLKKYGIKSKLKWPNDVMVNSKKISGILTETNIVKNKLSYILIGIGLNVNGIKNVEGKSTSMYTEVGKKQKKNIVLRTLLRYINRYFNEYLNGNETFKEIFNSNSYLYDKYVTFNNEEYLVLGVSPSGELIVEDKFGDREILFQSEVSLSDIYE